MEKQSYDRSVMSPFQRFMADLSGRTMVHARKRLTEAVNSLNQTIADMKDDQPLKTSIRGESAKIRRQILYGGDRSGDGSQDRESDKTGLPLLPKVSKT